MPDDISPEDRERLAKTKFKEWFDECFKETFEKSFDERVTATHQAAGTTPPAPAHQGQGQGTNHPERPRRRSLLEECFSQAFHIG